MSETGDLEKGDIGPKVEAGQTFNLKLRAPVFMYIADGLAPVYSKKLEVVRRATGHI